MKIARLHIGQVTEMSIKEAARWFGDLPAHLTPKQNDAFIAVSRLLKGNASVSRLTAPFTSGGRTHPVGSFYVAASGTASQIVQDAARQLGIRAEGVTSRPSGVAPVKLPRIALWDTSDGAYDSVAMIDNFQWSLNPSDPGTVVDVD